MTLQFKKNIKNKLKLTCQKKVLSMNFNASTLYKLYD